MQTLTTAQEITELTSKLRNQGLQIGFVPTMGALHDGHLSLIRASRSANDVTICSIFVNPSQFNIESDFSKYPRNLVADTELLESVNCDVLFAPSVSEVYPEADQEVYQLGEISEILEGTKRPGHFNGMASVVKRLFELTNPHRAYFGMKDYQQCLVVKSLVKNYHFDIDIVCCDILREDSGLAMSSRNQLLSDEGIRLATHLNKCLYLLKDSMQKRAAFDLQSLGEAYLEKLSGIELEYLEILDSKTLKKPNSLVDKPLVALIAAWIEGVRLIDNMILEA